MQSTVWIWTLFLALLQDDSTMFAIALSSCNKKWRLLQEEEKKEKKKITLLTQLPVFASTCMYSILTLS